MSFDKKTNWSIDESRDIYNIAHWSDGYFDINENGELIAYPNGKRDNGAINLLELTQAIHNLGLAMPTLVRFTDILTHRFDSLRNAFTQAIAENNYQAKFTGVYPIKVNQQRRVVEAIIKHGEEPVGLEAGSKPELMIVLALSTRGSVVVCNGYKDREYIRMALIGQRLGYKVYIILEKLSELATILEEARKMQVTPCLGIRVRLASMGAGKWQDTGGEKSKFGFSAVQVLQVIERLKAASALDNLQLLHFHLGSQIANILDIQRALREGGRYYVELRALGVPIHTVDVGGGLGVDYEGTHSRSFCSMNYSIQEYANNIVYTLAEVCNEKDVPHPNIITESGRAMTAHHALLITNVIDVERAFIPEETILPAQPEDTEVIKNLWESYSNLSERSALEAYHDACYWISEVRSTYLHGIISLAVCARAEQLYLAICHRVRQLLKPSIRAHREIIDELNEKLADKYFTNFSLFQSLPDTWAIDQIFPILPLSGLQNKPDRRGILQDITCDSDGRIECYVDGQGVETTLPLLPFVQDQPYLIGIFLVGAYQEILGDLHNLFGDTDSVHVELTKNGGYQLVHPLQGDTVESVLRYVQFDAKDLLQSYRQQFAQAGLSAEETQNCLQELIAGLHGYTYLED
jgi:arginine decarboxylase